MTPKDKAKEIVEKYLNASFNCKDCDMPYCDTRCTQLMKSEAQECALIAVSEIQELLLTDELYNPGKLSFDRVDEYWQEVKQEIIEL